MNTSKNEKLAAQHHRRNVFSFYHTEKENFSLILGGLECKYDDYNQPKTFTLNTQVVYSDSLSLNSG